MRNLCAIETFLRIFLVNLIIKLEYVCVYKGIPWIRRLNLYLLFFSILISGLAVLFSRPLYFSDLLLAVTALYKVTSFKTSCLSSESMLFKGISCIVF